ncbi:UNKNOWN [Stylonychia lemnae]|uniref:Uncharacterized protein n=1 Tax=Stylonychia lemnae TaxID=5949 RepID=A0A078ASU1_STYLE|nr:UNKNOWN [Stylonychia lemnae]|eukprot:CDW84282.1 UNKNOWN [Stylonychia lemnae]
MYNQRASSGQDSYKSSTLTIGQSSSSQSQQQQQQQEVLCNLSNQNKISDENAPQYMIPSSITSMSMTELQKELVETKDKLKVITQKFVNVRKERDQFKQENKDLQEEVLQLQSSIRQMVPCFSNTSSAFPMQNEMANIVSEFYKCDCQDVFFDLLCPELNLDGVIYFFQNTIPVVIEVIEKHFQPVEHVLKKVTNMQQLDGPIVNVLRKTYQSNWRTIYQSCLPQTVNEQIMSAVQKSLSIGDEQKHINQAITDFIKKIGEVAFQMLVSDPPIVFDIKRIGEKVQFNSFKYDSMDGFIKGNEECLIILPSVHKYNQGGGLGEVVIKANVLPLSYEFP